MHASLNGTVASRLCHRSSRAAGLLLKSYASCNPDTGRCLTRDPHVGASRHGTLWVRRCQHASLHVASHTFNQISRNRIFSASAAASEASLSGQRRKIVFLGTPEVAASVLKQLFEASQLPEATFEVAAVVTQPGKPRGRKKTPQPSHVEVAAEQLGVNSIWTPAKARDEGFLEDLRQLAPDLCVTAAYGNILPQAFLDIPRFGTLNIHPSLLPRWRGAAPVPRSLQAGETETGVSIAFTVRAMDAGPVAASATVVVPPEVHSPQLLAQLFQVGAGLLVDMLPEVWSGAAIAKALPQDDSLATHAAKMTKDEAALKLSRPALELHNAVRAFSGWPASTMRLWLSDEEGGVKTAVTVKVLEARLPHPKATGQSTSRVHALRVPCGPDDSEVLEVLRLQPENKKPMTAKDFANGFMRGRRLSFRDS